MSDDPRVAVLCTKEEPWDGRTTPVIHIHAEEVADSQEGGWPGGDTVRVRCPVCGFTWTEELPQ